MSMANGVGKVTMIIAFSYILIQPILDLVTSLSLHIFEKEMTASLVVRIVFLFYISIYMLISMYPNQKRIILYFTLFIVFLGIHLFINYNLKPHFHLFGELKYIIKLVYFVGVLQFYFVLFNQIKLPTNNAIRNIVIANIIIGMIMLISALTGTAFSSYEGGKEGNVGWFYAGNELGAILAMGFPLVVFVALVKSNLYWISVALSIYSLMALGTKVGFGAIILVLFIALVMAIYKFFIHKKNGGGLIILVAFLFFTIAYTPFSPLAHNMNMHLSWLGLEHQTNKTEQITNEQVENLVYSGREKFLAEQKLYYREAPVSQKLFGMGYGGNYQEVAKLIEMDFYDVFFSFGIIGTILYFAPIIMVLIKLFKLTGLNPLRYLNTKLVFIMSGIILGFGISFTAGHVLTAPAVSFYLALLLSYFVINLEQKRQSNK
jgi:hypothetical protein